MERDWRGRNQREREGERETKSHDRSAQSLLNACHHHWCNPMMGRNHLPPYLPPLGKEPGMPRLSCAALHCTMQRCLRACMQMLSYLSADRQQL